MQNMNRPVSSATFVNAGYFHIISWFCANPWLEISSLYSFDHSIAHTWQNHVNVVTKFITLHMLHERSICVTLYLCILKPKIQSPGRKKMYMHYTSCTDLYYTMYTFNYIYISLEPHYCTHVWTKFFAKYRLHTDLFLSLQKILSQLTIFLF